MVKRHVQKKINLECLSAEKQLVDDFTKGLPLERLYKLEAN